MNPALEAQQFADEAIHYSLGEPATLGGEVIENGIVFSRPYQLVDDSGVPIASNKTTGSVLVADLSMWPAVGDIVEMLERLDPKTGGNLTFRVDSEPQLIVENTSVMLVLRRV